MRNWWRWVLGVLAALLAFGVPTAYYRSQYTNLKRFREVSAGKLYRSGQFTASGFRTIIETHHIRTVINLQEENEDPFMPEEWLAKPHIRESDICKQYGLNYYALFGSETVPQDDAAAGQRPKVIDHYLKILDDPKNYPILLHCRAGLHRTGCLTAIYRMEFEKRTPAQAIEELRANGFGTFASTTGNIYIQQYIEQYRPGVRNTVTRVEPILAEEPR